MTALFLKGLKYFTSLALLKESRGQALRHPLELVLCSKSMIVRDKWVPEEPVPLQAVCLRAGSRATCKGLNYYDFYNY